MSRDLAPPAEDVAASAIADWRVALTESEIDDRLTDSELIDSIAELERLKSAAAATQARLTAEFSARRLAAVKPGSSGEAQARRSVTSEIALARQESPFWGRAHANLAPVLLAELPWTFAALETGQITEQQAVLVARETALLNRDDRLAADAALVGRLAALGSREIESETRRIAYRLDPQQAVDRAKRAESERRVTVRPAPDNMAYLTALVSLPHGVAAYAALLKAAEQARNTGDPRRRGQVMADEFITRLTHPAATTPATDTHSTGAAEADVATADNTENAATAEGVDLCEGLARLPDGIDVELHLVMTDRSLFDGDDEPAILTGHGPIAAPIARHLLRTAPPGVRIWLRRLYTDTDGNLTGGDPRRRFFPDVARTFLIARDQRCRTPWCGAPIRHADHITGAAAGGPTHLTNGQGLCEHCNQVKQAAGW